MNSFSRAFKNANQMQRGINMVDLMMWLVIAAMLLAAALQGIGYYQKSAYIYQMKNDALHAAELVTAKVAQEDGSYTTQTVALGVNESAKTKDVSITPDEGTSDADGYVLRTTHPEITDKDVLFLSAQRGDYSPGIHVVEKGTVIAPDGETTIDPDLASGGGTGGETVPTPTIDTSAVMTSIWDTRLTYKDYWGDEFTCSTITVPLTGTVNATIDWGDGNTDTYAGTLTSLPSHPYVDTPGVHTITITGTFTGWVGVNWDTWSNGCITSVTSWGDGTNTIDAEGGFDGAHSLTDIVRIPTTVTNASYLVSATNVFTGANVQNWDTSNITEMHGTFSDTKAFNGDISNWDVSNVETMGNMFINTSFRGDISKWDTSSVESMGMMFYESEYNGDISNWDVSNVKNMVFMFHENPAFNGDLSKWNTSSVTNMARMFDTSVFNGDISDWNTSSVTSIEGMFTNSPFSGDISDWDTSKVTSMQNMFKNAPAFNSDISGWNTSNVTSMGSMFQNSSFNQNIGAWDTTKVEWLNDMFSGNTSFNQDLGNWKVSNTQYFYNMFYGATSFNQDLTRWVTKPGAWSGGFSTNSGLTANHLPTFR